LEEEQRVPLNKQAMFTYIIITLGFTWACWIPSLLWAEQADFLLPTISSLAAETPFSFANQRHVFISLLFSLAVYGPLLGGFTATYMAQGKPGGRLGLSDITRSGPLPAELDGLLAWIACIADAQLADRYVTYLESAGLLVDQIENHDEALNQTAIDLQGKLVGAELLVKLNKINLPGIDLRQTRRVARDASKAIRDGKLGYTLIVASSPAG
jgi:hypothetical protein